MASVKIECVFIVGHADCLLVGFSFAFYRFFIGNNWVAFSVQWCIAVG